MTFAEAQEIRKLLNTRDDLISQLKNLANCESIVGHINDGVNGLGFRWDARSIHVKWLIKGVREEITRIEEAIARIETKDSTERNENGKKID